MRLLYKTEFWLKCIFVNTLQALVVVTFLYLIFPASLSHREADDF